MAKTKASKSEKRVRMSSRRSANFTHHEKEILLSLMQEYRHIVEDKRTDGMTVKEKNAAWIELTNKYNSQNEVWTRSVKQLRQCWKNLKSRARIDFIRVSMQGSNVADTDRSTIGLSLIPVGGGSSNLSNNSAHSTPNSSISSNNNNNNNLNNNSSNLNNSPTSSSTNIFLNNILNNNSSNDIKHNTVAAGSRIRTLSPSSSSVSAAVGGVAAAGIGGINNVAGVSISSSAVVGIGTNRPDARTSITTSGGGSNRRKKEKLNVTTTTTTSSSSSSSNSRRRFLVVGAATVGVENDIDDDDGDDDDEDDNNTDKKPEGVGRTRFRRDGDNDVAGEEEDEDDDPDDDDDGGDDDDRDDDGGDDDEDADSDTVVGTNDAVGSGGSSGAGGRQQQHHQQHRHPGLVSNNINNNFQVVGGSVVTGGPTAACSNDTAGQLSQVVLGGQQDVVDPSIYSVDTLAVVSVSGSADRIHFQHHGGSSSSPDHQQQQTHDEESLTLHQSQQQQQHIHQQHQSHLHQTDYHRLGQQQQQVHHLHQNSFHHHSSRLTEDNTTRLDDEITTSEQPDIKVFDPIRGFGKVLHAQSGLSNQIVNHITDGNAIHPVSLGPSINYANSLTSVSMSHPGPRIVSAHSVNGTQLPTIEPVLVEKVTDHDMLLVDFRKTEHNEKMKNIRLERRLISIEHKARMGLIKLKSDYVKMKMDVLVHDKR